MKNNSILLKTIVFVSAAITGAVILLLIGYIFITGVPNFSFDLFSPNYNSKNMSLFPSLINTLIIVILALALSIPIGVSSAIYLVLYAKKGNKIVSFIRISCDTLAAIPSIVYGLFGMIFFVGFLGFSYSILAGALTVGILILPLIMRTTEEALLSVSPDFIEGSFSLGAGKVRTIFRIVLPAAQKGIFAGIILAMGRIIGESAALIFTAGTVSKIPLGLFDSGRTLAVHMYTLSSEGLHLDKASATAVVLLLFILVINTLAAFLEKRLTNI